ncbi:putative transcription regulator, MerR family [Winogradskyella psychrotolerans RS-3]|uniref:Putative transcription regulator, MerR family n=1 Tax=Winogradskyella psychrotolerans RS-3 TaxID=641526 RepID=S7VLD1_9FLAO|nr:GyrI-like domain-containing protein [Winogradskyella psychrotolerans]EPR70267.1 putative transcription regulator, MerR family [Winogradskyella psychrotolerans RS-3]
MNPKIKESSEIKVIGLSAKIKRHEQHKIVALWKQFMPRKHELETLASEELIAIQVFSLQKNGEPKEEFEIWACAEVTDFKTMPQNLKSFTIPSGKYAVFLHKGTNARLTYENIMSKWLENSGYLIDDRPHFQVMGETYENGSPDSEEDFYVPIRLIKN